MVIDSHCHLTDDAFEADRGDVIARARACGVSGLVCVASTPADAASALALARAHPGVWCTAGVHPHEAEAATPEDFSAIERLLQEPEVVAIGECGLDFHYDHPLRETQRRVFARQVDLALETSRPLVVHSREADDDMSKALRDLPNGVRGVLHCFTGGDDLLEAALAAGWYVSFSGIVTFKKFTAVDQVRAVPAERLLVETDAPYLAPVPHRGRRNEPAFITETLARVAALRGEAESDIRECTAANAARLYGLPLA